MRLLTVPRTILDKYQISPLIAGSVLLPNPSQATAPYEGLRLRHACHDYVEPLPDARLRQPLQQGVNGALDIMDEVQFAMLLMECGHHCADVERVAIQKLQWDFEPLNGMLHRYVISNLPGTQLADVILPALPKRGQPPDPEPPQRDEFDFLEDMSKTMRDAARAEKAARRLVHNAAVLPEPPLHSVIMDEQSQDELMAAVGDLLNVDAFGDTLKELLALNDAEVGAEEAEVDAEGEAEEEAGEEAEVEAEVDAQDALDERMAPETIVEEPQGSWRYNSVRTGARVGRLHMVMLSVKATCHVHPNCACHVSARPGVTMQSIADDLIEWLGRFEVDAQEHKDMARALKKDKYKMRVRR